VTKDFDWTELERPGLRIGFTPAKQMGAKLSNPRRNAVILHLVTRDVRGLLRKVGRAGARVFGPKQSPDGAYWYGGFKDPEGNPVWVIDLEA
jgi:predicted enzyme related to lactoylglutathione lyase